jgi:outer membrane protein assembly factor BamB
MAATAVPPARKRSFRRFWLPLILVGLAAAALAALWATPDLERAVRVAGTLMLGVLTVLLLNLWMLSLSGWRFWVRLAVLLLEVGGLGVLHVITRNISFSGDMVPTFHFIWERPPAELLEADRQAQAAAADTVVDLSRTDPADFPAYRGVNRDGVVHGPALRRDWNPPPQPLWRQPVGGGYAAFAVAGNGAVTIEQRRDEEAVVCYDTATGRERWAYRYPDHFNEPLGGEGPRATPTISDGDVYALGANGKLVRLEGNSGTPKWEVDILQDRQKHNLPWAMVGAPLVYDDVVVVSPGVQNGAPPGRELVAYDRATANQVWQQGNAYGGYSSPMLVTPAGRRQVLLFDGDGVAGFDDKGGGELWRFPWKTNQHIHAAQPVVLTGDRVFISSGYGVGEAMLQVTHNGADWSVRPLWKTKHMACKFTSPVVRDDYLYGLDDGVLACLAVQDGAEKWRGDRFGHGQVLRADDLLVVLAEDGEAALVEAAPDAYRELGRFQAVTGDKTWNNPALANGKLYVRNHHEMACYDLSGR